MACKSILRIHNVKPKSMQEATVITVWPKML